MTSRRRTPLRGASGFTLTELMVVLGIIAITLGFGVAMIGRNDKGMGLRAGTNQVIATVRFARGSAIAERSPSYVVIDAADRTLSHVSKKTMGLWHLEDTLTTGALGRNGAPSGGQLVPGRIGQAYYFQAAGLIDCGALAPYAPEQGLVLECWAFLEEHSPMILLAKGDDYGLRITREGYLEAYVGELRISTAPEVVPFKKWFYVEAILTTPLPPLPVPPAEGEEETDASGTKKGNPPPKKGFEDDDESAPSAPPAKRTRTFLLFVNDQPAGATATEDMDELPRSSARLTLSSDEEPMFGALDEVRVSALVEGERYKLPDKVTFLGDSQTLRFDATGRLGQPAEILLKSGEETQTIRVGVLGNIE